MNYLLTGQESKRLLFDKFDKKFLADWLEFYTEPNGAAFLGMKKGVDPMKLCEDLFERMKMRRQNELGGMNALIEKVSNKFIGISGLLVQEVDEKVELEIAYSLLPEYRSKGFATEAALKCLNFAFENKLADSLISIIDVRNINSEKVALKIGMKKEKKVLYRGIDVNIFRIGNKAFG